MRNATRIARPRSIEFAAKRMPSSLGYRRAATCCLVSLGVLAAPIDGRGMGFRGAAQEEGTRSEADADTAQLPVDYALTWLRDERDRLASDMERFHAALLLRAQSEDPSLVERLEKNLPTRLPRGYGMLPEIQPDDPLGEVTLRETTYSLEFSTRSYSWAFRDAAVLSQRAERDSTLPLEWAVGEYERIQLRLKNLDDNLAYQEFWQPEVCGSREFFDERNRVLESVRELRTLRKEGGDPTRIAELELDIRTRVAPFQPTPGLEIQAAGEGPRRLEVTVHTDIQDQAFLDTFIEAVRVGWTEAPAAVELGLDVELRLVAVSPDELYPEGPPARGDELDLVEHLRRFGEGKLVLTTGAESTHSIIGRYVQIGVRAVKPRVLAHEFGHLLGFSDAYLRGYEGEPEDAYGVRIIEVTGLLDDLMGSPARGRTTKAMIEELEKAYGN